MRDAEQVTFGGSGLDRAAALRADAPALAALAARDDTRILPVWRGKPLFADENGTPGWLTPGHAVLDAAGEKVFLGLDDGAARFAADISAWEPAEMPETLGAFFDPSRQRHPELNEPCHFAELRGAMAKLDARSAELLATARALLCWHETHGFCARCGVRSENVLGGWQRTCPACGAHHFPRTDPVVIMLILHGNDVLVGRSPGWPETMYSLLAGFVEPGETIEAAVRREVFEESGVRVGAVTYLASQPWPFPASLMVGCLGYAEGLDLAIDPTEIEDARWVSRERMARVWAGRDPDMAAARKGSIAHFLIGRWLMDRLD